MNSFPETYIDPYYQLLKIGSVVNTVEIKQTNKQTKTCMIGKVFKNRRERENGVLPTGWSVGSGKKKTRNGGESFQEQARHREWVVTQGWPVGSAKIGTVATVLYLSIIFIPRDLLTY